MFNNPSIEPLTKAPKCYSQIALNVND